MDALYLQALDVGQAISQNGSYITGALAGLLMFLVAALMATVSIIVISAAKIMIGVLVIFAPVAIACTLFKVTAPLFDRWVNLALSFALYPMLTSGMAAFTIYIAADLANEPHLTRLAGERVGRQSTLDTDRPGVKRVDGNRHRRKRGNNQNRGQNMHRQERLSWFAWRQQSTTSDGVRYVLKAPLSMTANRQRPIGGRHGGRH